jgi:hypothetical protein
MMTGSDNTGLRRVPRLQRLRGAVLEYLSEPCQGVA